MEFHGKLLISQKAVPPVAEKSRNRLGREYGAYQADTRTWCICSIVQTKQQNQQPMDCEP